MKAGKLSTFIKIQRLAAGAGVDAIGQPVTGDPNWVEFATAWADVRYKNGLESIKADAESSTAKASIRLRYREGITTDMRILDGAAILNIKAVLPDRATRQYVDLVCEVVT